MYKRQNLYYFNTTNGAIVKNRLQAVGNDTYYLQKNGTAAKNKWVTISSKQYYFQTDGKMAKGTWVGQYYVDANGVKTSQTRCV